MQCSVVGKCYPNIMTINYSRDKDLSFCILFTSVKRDLCTKDQYCYISYFT